MIGSARRLGGTAAACCAGLAIFATPAFGAANVIYGASSFGSQFIVVGEADDEQISITVEGNTITVTDTGIGGISTADPNCANPSLITVTCPFDPPDPAPPADPTAPVVAAGFDLQGANDTLTSSAPFFTQILAGAGDDIINAGPDDDTIIGGEGNDQLFGGDGDDAFDGGTTGTGAGGADLIDGQGGIDFVQFPRIAPVNVSLNGLPDDGVTGEGDNAIAEEVFTGRGDDTVTGDAEANFLTGGQGNDTISGLGGNDVLDGDEGDDGLIGGPQRDQFECDQNFDTAIVEPRDIVEAECERRGAEVADSTATVNKKSKVKVEVTCPAEEANQCDGTLALFAGSKELGSTSFSVGSSFTGKATVKLNKDGRELLDKNGGTFLGTAEAQTTEPIGTSIAEGDVLLKQKSG